MAGHWTNQSLKRTIRVAWSQAVGLVESGYGVAGGSEAVDPDANAQDRDAVTTVGEITDTTFPFPFSFAIRN